MCVFTCLQAFHFYTTEAKAQCLAFEGTCMIVTARIPYTDYSVFLGEKFLIRWYRGYLISVSKGGRGGGARGGALAAAAGGSGESMTLTIYDIQNQFLGECMYCVCMLTTYRIARGI